MTLTLLHTTMDLILWRHAEAVEPTLALADADRALTPKGHKQAERMARWLNLHLPRATVLASPALRTRQTADALGRKARTVDALAPGRGVDELLRAAGWPDAALPVIVVGHQPTLGQVAAHLLTGEDMPWAVRKGAIWWLRLRERDGGEVVLQTVLAPDQV